MAMRLSSWRLLPFVFGVLVLSQYPLLSRAATDDADSVIRECQKRTGLSESGCIGFIKKYMDVERCQQYTSFSTQECEQKIVSIKKDPRFQSSATNVQTPPIEVKTSRPGAASDELRTNEERPTTLRGRVLEAKREKEQRFLLIHDETQALITYLKQQGQDVGELEAMLQEFDAKKQATLLAYDRYQSFAEASHSDESYALEGPSDTVLWVLRDATEYYRQYVLPALQQAVAINSQR